MKTWMLATSRQAKDAYPNILSGMKVIAAKEGIHGLYHGLMPSLLGVLQYAIQFSIYENFKIWRLKRRGKLSSLDVGMLSACAKLLSGTLVYPYQVLRSRIQNSPIKCDCLCGHFRKKSGKHMVQRVTTEALNRIF